MLTWLYTTKSVNPLCACCVRVESRNAIQQKLYQNTTYVPRTVTCVAHSLQIMHCVWSEENVQPQQPPTIDQRLTESDILHLMEKLAPHAAKWSLLGMALGFTPSELKVMEAKPSLIYNAPTSYLAELLYEWVQWSPKTDHAKYTTLSNLRQALRMQLGHGSLIHDSFHSIVIINFHVQWQ